MMHSCNQVKEHEQNTKEQPKFYQAYLSQENTTALRGILVILVIITHIRGEAVFINDTIIGSILTISAYPSLGLFFFLTGFGLRESMIKKKHYSERFFSHRIIPFYLDYILFLVFYIVFHCIMGRTIEVMSLLKSLTWGGTYINNGWYLQTTMLIYLSFWLAFTFGKKSPYVFGTILWTCFAAYILLCLSTDNAYFAQFIIGVPLGYYWSKHKNVIDKIIQKYYLGILCLSAMSALVTIVLGMWYTNGILQFGIITVSVALICITCLTLLALIPVQCRLLTFIGTISLEIYVFHGVFLELFVGTITSWRLFMQSFFIVLIASVFMAFFMHKIIFKINSIKKKKLHTI